MTATDLDPCLDRGRADLVADGGVEVGRGQEEVWAVSVASTWSASTALVR